MVEMEVEITVALHMALFLLLLKKEVQEVPIVCSTM